MRRRYEGSVRILWDYGLSIRIVEEYHRMLDRKLNPDSHLSSLIRGFVALMAQKGQV